MSVALASMFAATPRPTSARLAGEGLLLIGIGDSLTQGTMDATNNATNTTHAYLQQVADALSASQPLRFSQPLLDDEQQRISPFQVPSNLGVDGADLFRAEGFEYDKRVGAPTSYVDNGYLCEVTWPWQLQDKYDKVLYPLNLLAKQAVSQVDGVVELLERNAASVANGPSFVVHWLGNNDSSLAALGSGGANPAYLPIPYTQMADELDPLLRAILRLAEAEGAISFAPYTADAIQRNLTDLVDFEDQLGHILDRIEAVPIGAGKTVFVLTLPYYSSVGYLMDSEDLEFYLRKLATDYSVPPSFARVSANDPFSGDRVSLLTFGLMYALLATGTSIDEVNSVLEVDGQQADGLVMSATESHMIRERSDGFNAALAAAVAERGTDFHLVDIARDINSIFAGDNPIYVDGEHLTRNWSRGEIFSLDGVHPGYTAQAFIANKVLAAMDAVLGGQTTPIDLSAVHAQDPYADHDEDGWGSGPDSPASGIAELLFLLKDPDDNDATVQVTLPNDVWGLISRVLLAEVLGISRVRSVALSHGLIDSKARFH